MSRHLLTRWRWPLLALAELAVFEAVAYVAVATAVAAPVAAPVDAVVKIRWADAVSDEQRPRLERELGLVEPTFDSGTTWSYRLVDLRVASVRAIVTHPAVADTDKIDRLRYVPLDFDQPDVAPPAAILPIRMGLLACLALSVFVASGASRVSARGAARARAVAVKPFATMSRPVQSLVFFALGFVPLLLAGNRLDAQHPEWRDGSIYQRGLPLPASNEFLSQDPEMLDNDVYYQGLYGTASAAQRADVIFAGNSRAVYAFRREALKPHFDRAGLTYYSLAFSGGADAFPLELMRRHDIRPKILVVSMHGFFANDLMRFGDAAIKRDAFTAWNYVWERQWSWQVRSHLHRFVPHWPTEVVDRKGTQVIYRRIDDGTSRWVMPIVEPKPLGDFPVPRHPGEDASIEQWTALQLKHAKPFIDEMASRGTQVVLVYVPWTDWAYFPAEAVAAAVGKPLIVAWPDGLIGAIGSHMDEKSATRYVDALMPMLLETPEFKAILPARPAAQ